MVPRFAEGTAREVLGIGEGQVAVLVGYGEDPLVEAFWTCRHQLIRQLAAQQWDLVLACNFFAVAKHGNGPVGSVPLTFHADRSHFTTASTRQELL